MVNTAYRDLFSGVERDQEGEGGSEIFLTISRGGPQKLS